MSSQKNNAELARRLIFEIRHFIARSILYNQKVAERMGLHVTDLQCLNILDLLGPLKPGQLAEFTGLTTGGVTVVLDRLEKAKYVRRQANPNDRRSVFVHIVPARVRKLGTRYQTVQEQVRALLSGFSEVELAALLKFFTLTNAIPPTTYTKHQRQGGC